MVRLTAADEGFVHQLPEPLPNVATYSEHWRESYFFVLHPPAGDGDAVIIAMAHYPAREVVDALLMGRIDGQLVFSRHERPYDGDPHSPTVGPVRVDIAEPYRTVHVSVADQPDAAFTADLTFAARTAAHGLRRGTMKAGHETVWDQSHMIQSGLWSGRYAVGGRSHEVDGWWGQRDHSWGIRDHSRCPLWIWLAIQVPDGMYAVWHWELPNGARIYTDGCFAPADGSEPVPVIDFSHHLSWTDEDGTPVGYGRDGEAVRGLAGHVELTLAGGQVVGIDGEGTWAMPYGGLGGGQHLMQVRTDDGRTGSAIYEVTGAGHHHFFPVHRHDRLPS